MESLSLLGQFFIYLDSMIRVAVPLIMVALAGFMSERSGVTNIALEGKMLFGAFVAGTMAYYLGNLGTGFFTPHLAMLSAGIGGMLVGLLYAFFVIYLKANQIITATAINLLAMGMTPFLFKVFFNSTGQAGALDDAWKFKMSLKTFYFEGIGVRIDIPGFPIWFCLFLVLALCVWYYFTRSGLWMRFAGEHPKALETTGISVEKVRWFCLAASGFLAGLGGSVLVLYMTGMFTKGMSAGRGFLALAALIMGKWSPIGAVLACFLFAFVDVLQIPLQNVTVFDFKIPVQWVQMLPYLLTLFVLAGVVGKSRPPGAVGAKD